jgi:hypothetical protein
MSPTVVLSDANRIDILRQQQKTGSPRNPVVQDVPYSPVGVDLGDGLFEDLRGNLSLVIAPDAVEARSSNFSMQSNQGEQLTGATTGDSVQVTEGFRRGRITRSGADTVLEDGPDRRVIHRDGQVTSIWRGRVLEAQITRTGPTHVDILQPTMGSGVTTLDTDATHSTLRQSGRFGSVTEVQRDKPGHTQATFPGGAVDVTTDAHGRTTVERTYPFGNVRSTTIRRSGNNVEVDSPGVFGTQASARWSLDGQGIGTTRDIRA